MAQGRPPVEQIDAIYQRLLAGEGDAPSDLIVLLLDPLIAALSRKFRDLDDSEIVTDMVTDTLFRFVQDPSKYQPDRGNLWSYLYMDALGDLQNAYQKAQRRNVKSVPFDLVAHDVVDGNIEVEDTVIQKLVPDILPDGLDPAAMIAQLRADIPDQRDWEVVKLMAMEERRTAVYAAILGIDGLPPEEQARIVKRTKDRLRLRLKRRGVKMHEE